MADTSTADSETADTSTAGEDLDDRAPADTMPPAGTASAQQLTRSGRVKKWDREAPPHDWRWYVGTLGRICIALGVLMFGFVAYQLWGTGIETARAQRSLENDFEEQLAEAPPPPTVPTGVESSGDTTAASSEDSDDSATAADESDSGESDGGDAGTAEPVADAGAVSTATVESEPVAVPVEDQVIPDLERGDALARLEIPTIGVDDIVVAGVSTSDLKKGPGHFPDTPIPGQLGNAAIAGHRTTYGQPFHDVDKLEVGDEIVVTTLNGVFTYRVTGQQIVSPSDYQVVATTDPTRATLTLTSCHPKWTAQQRIVIFSELDETLSGPVGEPVLNYGEPVADIAPELPSEATVPKEQIAASQSTDVADVTTVDADEPGADEPGVEEVVADEEPASAEPSEVAASATSASLASEETTEGIADAFAEGWFSDSSANPHVGFWGIVLALVGIGAYLLSRRFRNDLIGLAVGIVPFVVALYFFFQNVNRLLPPNL